MCLTPSTLRDGKTVACRQCRICIDNRVNDLVGRCLAEQATSSSVLALTLTYKGDTPAAVVFNYKDVQDFIAYVRSYYNIRYIVAGEYGGQKGRVHWHLILFFKGEIPTFLTSAEVKTLPRGEHGFPIFGITQFAIERRAYWQPWPHGIVYMQYPDYKGFRYLLKYALKDHKPGSARQSNWSKRPPLGVEFFRRMAYDAAQKRIPIHDPIYRFKDVLGKDGQPRKFWLSGVSRRLFLQNYVAAWREFHADDPPETEFLLQNLLDPLAAEEMELADVASGHFHKPAWLSTPDKFKTGTIGEKRAPRAVSTSWMTPDDEDPLPTLFIRQDGKHKFTILWQRPATYFSFGRINVHNEETGEEQWIADNVSAVLLSGVAQLKLRHAEQIATWVAGCRQRQEAETVARKLARSELNDG